MCFSYDSSYMCGYISSLTREQLILCDIVLGDVEYMWLLGLTCIEPISNTMKDIEVSPPKPIDNKESSSTP